MTTSEMERKILDALPRFASLDFQVITRMVLADGGNFTLTAERELRETLQRMASEGRIGAGGPFGPFWSLKLSAQSADAPRDSALPSSRQAVARQRRSLRNG